MTSRADEQQVERSGPRPRLLIFAKVPMPGGAKTRLVPPLDEQEASDLARAFLLDAAERLSCLPGIDAWLYLATSSGDRRALEESLPELFRSPLGENLVVRFQRGEGLGERLLAAFEEAFDDGCAAVCAVGSDHPTLPDSRIIDAFRSLAEHDLAIGPADDGGYYLVGMRSLRPGLLLDKPYSTPRLFEAVMNEAATEALASFCLESWYDVDDAASLERLRSDRVALSDDSHTARMLGRLETRSRNEATAERKE